MFGAQNKSYHWFPESLQTLRLLFVVLSKAKDSHILEAVINMLVILVQDYILEDVASSPGWTLDGLTPLA